MLRLIWSTDLDGFHIVWRSSGMVFELTSEQSMLRDTIRSYLDDRYDARESHRVANTPAGWLRTHWDAFANDLGILGAPFSEQLGGMGGGAVENAVILEQLGESR